MACVFCTYLVNWEKLQVTTFRTVYRRGILSICEISRDKGDELYKIIEDLESIEVHEKCRVNYLKAIITTPEVKRRKITKVPDNNDNQVKSVEFDFEKNCIICAKKIQIREQYSIVVNNSSKQSVIDYHKNNETINSEIRDIICLKLLGQDNLSIVQAKYHKKTCSTIFRKNTSKRRESVDKSDLIKRSMELIFNYIDENEDNQFTIDDFHYILDENKMYTPCIDSIWHRLRNHYQENIIIIKKKGAPAYCCLKKKGYNVLHESYTESLDDSSDQKIIEKAAKIILDELKEECTDKFTEYPASDSMFKKARKLPKNLEYLLQKIILNQYRKEKNSESRETVIISIAHAIMTASFPRLIHSPLHIAVGVALHRKFGSRELVDICHAMGFSCTYNEVRTYESSAALQGEIELKNGAFIQFVSDNADWNLETLDGKGTFHSLGSCEIITPASYVLPRKPFSRLKSVSEAEVAAASKIQIKEYQFKPLEGLKFFKFPEPNKNANLKLTVASKINCYWMFRRYLKPNEKGWNGFMENLTKNNTNFEFSAINFLPFIHASPSEYNTLYTALTEAISLARKFGMNTCVITFDQPLYLKLRDVIGALILDNDILVVIRLGGFHMLMSFLGSMGFIMKDSGLVEVLTTIYAECTIKKILSGHQYARAVRAHSLVHLALAKKIFSRIKKKNPEFSAFENIDFPPEDVDDLLLDEDFRKVTAEFEKELEILEKTNPTCKLWVQYCKMVLIVNDFMYAEKTGDWELHLKTVERMLPFFHATGHFPYAKSAQLYLKDMKDLKEKMNSTEYQKFTKDGFWTARRTNKFYSGIFTDQTIEQTLMRQLKFEGGLFRRGVTESVAYQWIRGFIFTKDIIEGLEKFTSCTSDRNYQHKDSSDNRIQLDSKALELIEKFFEQFDPFCDDTETLINIANGMSGSDKANCHNAFEKGLEIMDQIKETKFTDLKLSRKKIVKTIASSNSTITVDQSTVEIDPDILFHRICVVKKSDEEMRDYLRYELSPFPQAYFNTFGMLKNTKSDLYKYFIKSSINVRDPLRTHYIMDGGFLIHKVKWTLHQSFSSIMDNYVKYIKNNYGNICTVVFDGYESLTTKASERNRRDKHKASADVYFNENMSLKISQEKFLSNTKNKNNIIKMLQNKLTNAGIHSKQCKADADRTIVTTAIEIAKTSDRTVVVVSEDTDVLVLVTALTPSNSEIFFIKPARPNKGEELYSSKSLSHIPSILENILFLHAFTGCDTVSATSNQGKTKFLKTFKNSPDLAIHANKFKEIGLTIDEIFQHGSQLILAMYGAAITFRKPNIPDEQKLSTTQLVEGYRYRMYLTAIAKNRKLSIGKILPTADAFMQHLKRVYFQVQSWLHGEEILIATDWGWELKDNAYVPVKMTLPPGPESILKVIFCSCKSDCGNSCGCRKHGLFCNAACKNCAGSDCTNIDHFEEEDEDENDESPEHTEEETDDESL